MPYFKHWTSTLKLSERPDLGMTADVCGKDDTHKGLTIWTLQADYLVLTSLSGNIRRPSASRNMYNYNTRFCHI